MTRPFACIGLGALAALAAVSAFDCAAVYIAAACIVASAVLFALRIFCKREQALTAGVVFLSAAAAVTFYICAVNFYEKPIEDKYDGQLVSFSGVITSQPYTNGKTTSFTVRTNSVNGERVRLDISVGTNAVPDGGEYDIIAGRAVLNKLDNDEIGLDYASYNKARNIFLGTYISIYAKTGFKVTKTCYPPPWIAFLKLRQKAAAYFVTCLPKDEASLCTAMLTGSKNGMTDGVLSRFRLLGLSHMIVVSGLHLSIVAALMYELSRRFIRIGWLACLVQLGGVFSFAALTGFGWSVRRAFLMLTVVLLSQITHSKPDPLNSLGFAAIVICLDPFAAGNVGLLWSFGSTLSLILLHKPFSETIVKRLRLKSGAGRAFAALFAASAAAAVGSVPFIVLVTKETSVLSLAANLLTVPFTGLIIVGGGAAVLLSLFGAGEVAAVFAFAAGLTAKYVLFVTEHLAAAPFSRVYLGSGVFAVWLCASVIVTIAAAFDKRKSRVRLAGAASAASFVLIAGVQVLAGSGATLSLLDVGSGITAVLKYDGEAAVVSSFGEPYQYPTIKRELSGYGSLSCIVDIPPPDAAYDYGRKLIKDFPASTVVIRDEALRRRDYAWYEYCGGNVAQAGDVHTIELADSITARIYCGEDIICEYLDICGSEVLIVEGGEGEIPPEYRSPDLAVVITDEHIDELSEDTCVIVSNTGVGYGDERIINMTAGEGRVDVAFTPDGISINQEYTGGVVTYADDN